MADYGRVLVRGVFSRNSDYSEPEQDTKTLTMALTPDECIHRIIDVPDGGGRDIVAANEFASTLSLVLRNNDASASLGVTWQDEGEGEQCILYVGAGQVAVLPGIDPAVAINLVSDNGTIEIEFMLLGT